MHRTPAGFPLGIPGTFDEIDGAIQQAPQPMRQASFCESGLVFIREKTGPCRRLSSKTTPCNEIKLSQDRELLFFK
jgi:hypothetical protein